MGVDFCLVLLVDCRCMEKIYIYEFVVGSVWFLEGVNCCWWLFEKLMIDYINEGLMRFGIIVVVFLYGLSFCEIIVL